ncbi:MAG: VTT domain-containing protein [Reyranella sp.]|nr:VTT domain-containing protein [Reyranella sp.]MBL6650741.1 VTT domain-containing protein [Reyranella sp.]
MNLLRPGHTVWRIERAKRAAVLVDAANFFAAVRQACLKAQRSILVVGWDIDSRTHLVGASGRPEDGYASDFAEFLSELVQTRPDLHVHLLLWDYSLLYAGERELLPRLSLGWRTPERITLCIDNSVPFGSSQHQKIVVIDDALAFSGGLDITIRRWDTQAHSAEDRERVDPTGQPYRPFHDVQMMVDGPAAGALALLARERWCHANGGTPRVEPFGDPWPDSCPADFTDVEVGIARTQPRYNGEAAISEVQALFLDSIDQAQRHIYIENQFLTSWLIADRLAERLRQNPELEIVIVAPRSHDSWVEKRTMRNGRIRFSRHVRAAGGERVRLLYPSVEQGAARTDTMVHSKVMIVDDRFLRVGSANLNNRSMGADTECDLAIEAKSDAERAAILRLRNRLLGEHCGVTEDEVAKAVARHGSLVRAAGELRARGHSLRPIDDGEPDADVMIAIAERIADPPHPLRPARLARHLLARFAPAFAVLGIVLVVLAFALAWRYTGLSQLVTSERIRDVLAAAKGEPWAILVVVPLFVLAGALAFPLNMLILATAAVFGPWLGMLYSGAGAISSGTVMFLVGSRLGRQALERRLGGRAKRALDGVRKQGVLAVVALRLVPLAPFTFVNLAAGAGGIRFVDFILGSVLGLLPGLALLSVMGDRIISILSHPTIGDIALVILCVLGLIGLAAAAQALLSRRGGRA